MRSDDELWLLLAAGALLVLTRDSTPWGDPTLWHWPVPDLLSGQGVAVEYHPAVVSQEFRRPSHLGVDVMFKRLQLASGLDMGEYKPGTHDGSDVFFAPQHVPVLAARDGVVWSVDTSARGIEVVLDHGKPFATYYQHLATTILPPMFKGKGRDGSVIRVRAGDVIGTMGYDPTDPEGLRHLHFAVWLNGDNDSSVDPEHSMRSWRRSTWRL